MKMVEIVMGWGGDRGSRSGLKLRPDPPIPRGGMNLEKTPVPRIPVAPGGEGDRRPEGPKCDPPHPRHPCVALWTRGRKYRELSEISRNIAKYPGTEISLCGAVDAIRA